MKGRPSRQQRNMGGMIGDSVPDAWLDNGDGKGKHYLIQGGKRNESFAKGAPVNVRAISARQSQGQ